MAEKNGQRIVRVEDDREMVELMQVMQDRKRFNIVVTAQNAPIDHILGEHIAQGQAYIAKPASPAELRGAVEMVLGSEPL